MTHLQERKLRVAKRRYTKEFREFAVERLRGCENIVALAKELHVSRRQLYRWRDEMDPELPGMEVPGQQARTSTLRKEVNHLKRVLAEKTLEVDFFRSALQKVEARRQLSSRSGEKASTSKSGR
jgi:transposase-like protein